MAKFEPGNKMSKGRPAGALNRSTEQAKLAVARLANQGLDALREDLEKIRNKLYCAIVVIPYSISTIVIVIFPNIQRF